MILLTMVNTERTPAKALPLCLPGGSTGTPSAESIGSAENPVNTLPMDSTEGALNFLTTLTPHAGLLAPDALAFKSASASVGSETLSESDQDNPVVPASTFGEVEEEKDVVEDVEEEDENILENFVCAQTDFDKDLPLILTMSVVSRMKNPLNKDGKNLFDDDLNIVWDQRPGEDSRAL
jgi:hypothetical protein